MHITRVDRPAHLRMWYVIVMLVFLLGLGSCREKDNLLSSPEFVKAMGDLNQYRSEKYLDIFPKLLDSSFNTLEKKRPLDRYHYYEYWAWINYVQEDFAPAISYTDSMLLVLTPLPNVDREYAHSLVQKGILLRDLNLYSEALREFYAANSYAERFTNQCAASEVYASLGYVLFQQESYEEALSYYKKAVVAARTCDSTRFEQFVAPIQNYYTSKGLCYERLGIRDSAIFMYQRASDFIDLYEDKFPRDSTYFFSARGVIFGNWGNVEMQGGNLKKAKQLFKESIALNRDKGFEIKDAIYTQIKLAHCFLKANELDSIPPLMHEIDSMLLRFPNGETSKRYNSFKVDYYTNLEETNQAFTARETYLRIVDSLTNLKRELPAINIRESFSYFSQKEELNNLKTANQRKFLWLLVTLALVLLLIITVYLHRINLHSSKRHSEELTEINTELQTRMDQLNQTMKDLGSSQEENTRIMKIIAHDLRSPVSSINSMANMLMEHSQLDKEQKEGISMIRQISKDSLVFFEDLLNMRGSLSKEKKANSDLLELIDYCVNFMRLRADEKKQQLRVHGNHVFLPIYREKIWRVINNLISNAIKFSPTGSEIDLYLTETADYIRLEVRDKGMGIPAKMKNQIFNLMGDSKRSGTAGEKSYGLGLAICMQIMEAHNGRIWFESEESVGASFFIEFSKV